MSESTAVVQPRSQVAGPAGCRPSIHSHFCSHIRDRVKELNASVFGQTHTHKLYKIYSNVKIVGGVAFF